MSGITLAIAEAMLQNYLDAEEAVLSGQSYTIAGRSMTRADLTSIREGIEYWSRKYDDLGGSRQIRVYHGVRGDD